MKTVKEVCVLLALLVLAGCAALDKTPWKHDSQQYEEATIRWLRMKGSGFVDQGICYLQLADNERGLENAYPQMEACRKGTAVHAVATGQMKKVEMKKIRFYIVKTATEAESRWVDHIGMRAYKSLAKRMIPEVCVEGYTCTGVVGFQFDGSDHCGIVIARRYISKAGHEMKHCYDGEYHYASMRWKSEGKAFVPQPEVVAEKPAK